MLQDAIIPHFQLTDVHPWEAYTAKEMISEGGNRFPPLARTWGFLTQGSNEQKIRIRHNHAATTYCRVLDAAAQTMRTSLRHDVHVIRLRVPRHEPTDLPMDRLTRLGHDRVADWLVTALSHGEAWAADVLARLGTAPCP